MDEQQLLDLDLDPDLLVEPPPPLPDEVEAWPDPPPPTDWLGLQELAAGEVTRIYEGEATTPALPPLVRYKRVLMGWDPERPLAKIRVQCRPRFRRVSFS